MKLYLDLQCKYDDVRCKTQLVQLIQKRAEGIPVADLKASYPTAMNDIQVNCFISGVFGKSIYRVS